MILTKYSPPTPCSLSFPPFKSTTKIKIEFSLEKVKSETDEYQTCFSIAGIFFFFPSSFLQVKGRERV